MGKRIGSDLGYGSRNSTRSVSSLRVHPKPMTKFDFDVFISHASEDKVGFVTPLANELKKHGLRVWFDRFTLKVGDNLHQSIEKGLARSRYGVVVFSTKFLAKNWTQAELEGLFAREMDGHKVILPIWHKISSARMKKAVPMLAAKVALRSEDGIQAVARSLVEVVRPELLELENKRATAFEAADDFVAEASRKYPGYKFSIHSGQLATPNSADAPLTIRNAKRRIEIGISDASLIGKPPGGKIQFLGEGVTKAIDLEHTGKPQKWEPGEFRFLDWNVPLVPPHVEGSTFEVRSTLLDSPVSYMRVEVGLRPSIVFPIMEVRPVRIGTREAEVILYDKETPLSISLVFGLGPGSVLGTSREVNMTLSWKFAGKKVTECKKLLDAIGGLGRGRALRIVDIRLAKTILESTARLSGSPDPFPGNVRPTVLLATQIEKEFSVSLRIPEVISEQDGQSLFHLDCLLNGRAYEEIENDHIPLVKADGATGKGQEGLIKGEWTATLIHEPSNYPGYFLLFGQRVATRSWVRVVEFTAATPSANFEEFRKASLGAEFIIQVKAKGPASLRWKEDSAPKTL